ncbi:hypothetical protein RRG08_019005 [Elysia crispata]|uniref:Uncharacterized protein n=1 Tax=Elysia crispata TaxID=231223 RepID=A0AAE1DSL2_9GAST|nr:hypothetical protein RRG08_019005 [Elysia crispata]
MFATRRGPARYYDSFYCISSSALYGNSMKKTRKDEIDVLPRDDAVCGRPSAKFSQNLPHLDLPGTLCCGIELLSNMYDTIVLFAWCRRKRGLWYSQGRVTYKTRGGSESDKWPGICSPSPITHTLYEVMREYSKCVLVKNFTKSLKRIRRWGGRDLGDGK